MKIQLAFPSNRALISRCKNTSSTRGWGGIIFVHFPRMSTWTVPWYFFAVNIK